MKSVFLVFSKYIDILIDKLGRSTSWLTTILMILICVDVVLRYIWSVTYNWMVELEWHLFAVIFLVGASYTFLHDKHVRVDVFYEKYAPGRKRIANLLGVLLFLIPWSMVVIYYGWDYMINSYSFRESSSQPNGLPARYVIKSFIVIGFSLLLLQGISKFFKLLYHKDQ